MNSKIILILSAVLMALVGLATTFMPQEILSFSGLPPAGMPAVILQIFGAVYLGFAILNWTAKESVTGGIYNRPLTLGNFLHFFAAGMVLLKGAFSFPELWIAAGIYLLFAGLFFKLIFTHPLDK